MLSPTHGTFIRRPPEHWRMESTCKRCFLTVATAKREAELDRTEERHICDQWLVEPWKQLFD